MENKETVDTYIEQLYNSIITIPNSILETFNNFFGESKVDIQNVISLEDFTKYLKRLPTNVYAKSSLLENEDEIKSLYDVNEEKAIELLKSIENEGIESIKITLGTFFILVHFPEVTITNEYDNSVKIKDLYAKVNIKYNGTISGTFTLNRAHYPLEHLSNNYLHSHILSIPFDDFQKFQSPCLGSGPIRNTIASLSGGYDINLWQLFCFELSKYVQVESISGVPYHRLEHISRGEFKIDIEWRYVNTYILSDKKELIKDFTRSLIKAKLLKFNYVKGFYSIAMSPLEYLITISNYFIAWYNKNYDKYKIPLDRIIYLRILKYCTIANNSIYPESTTYLETLNRYKVHQNKKVCDFKGKAVLLNIEDINPEEGKKSTLLLNVKIAHYIASSIIKLINYKYGNKENDKPDEKVRYI